MKARRLVDWGLFVLLIAIVCGRTLVAPALGDGFDIFLGLIIALGLAHVVLEK